MFVNLGPEYKHNPRGFRYIYIYRDLSVLNRNQSVKKLFLGYNTTLASGAPAGPNLRSKERSTEGMASAEREPIMGVWGQSPSGVQGQSPGGGSGGLRPPPLKLKAF